MRLNALLFKFLNRRNRILISAIEFDCCPASVASLPLTFMAASLYRKQEMRYRPNRNRRQARQLQQKLYLASSRDNSLSASFF